MKSAPKCHKINSRNWQRVFKYAQSIGNTALLQITYEGRCFYMMRKFNKKKGSKRGAILVTVVFILAFAIIFIAAAMSLTQMTRRRIYQEAESSQARLTVTSVAEAFYRAVNKCEFDDADIIALCKGPTTIRVQASANADTVPGLENVGTSSTESYTTVKFSRTHHAGAATTDDDYTYYADFSTHIDGEVENVRAELSYVTPPTNKNGAPFSTQIDLNTKFGNNNMEVVGDGKEGDPDNIFLVRKGSANNNSSFSSVATMVYCDGEVTFKDELFKSTDVVFLQGAKLKTGDSGHFSSSSSVKNFFFFGSGTEPISNETSRGNFSASSNWNFYLCGRTNVGNWTSGGNVVEINANGTKKDGTAVFSNATTNKAFVEKVQKYAQYNSQYKADGTNQFPTTSEFLSSAGQIGNNKVTSKTAPSSATYSGSLGNFLTTYCWQNKNAALTSGTYVFTSDGSDTNMSHPGISNNEPYVIVLEGGKKYQFWFKGGVTFELFKVVFIVNDPKPSYPVLFLLESGAKVYWPGSGNKSNGRVCDNGIFAVEGRKFSTAEDTYKFIVNEQLNNKKPQKPCDFENSGKGYSSRYDGKNEPCAMVIGMGNNVFALDKNIIMEAFIGLFNDSYGSTAKSKFTFRNNDGGVFYGRVMTDGYDDSDSGSMKNPASPGASSLPSPNPPIKKMVTGFSLNSMKYYYGII